MPKPTRYRCPRCAQTIVLHVRPTQPPICRNPKAHGSTPVVMVPGG